MAKLKMVAIGTLQTIEKNNPEMDFTKWSWRKKYEGFSGMIEVYQSIRIETDHHFILIYDKTQNWLKTGIGTVDCTDNITLTLTTDNSKYTFKIQKEIYRKDGE